jgi:hypothetical protein
LEERRMMQLQLTTNMGKVLFLLPIRKGKMKWWQKEKNKKKK